jgi:two-component system sensor histidine kinase ChvG
LGDPRGAGRGRIYLVLAILAMLAAVSIFLSLRRFREVADEIGQGRIGDYAFSQRNIVPELSSVARDFDKLVLDLKHLSQQIRQSAEDNAHSFKTPLAAIQSSLSPVRRAVGLEEQRARGRSRSSIPRSPGCSPWSTPRSASTTARPT